MLACSSPALAADFTSPPIVAPVVAQAPLSVAEMFIAAQKAETLQAIALMHARLAEMVPRDPRHDSVSKAALGYAAHWNAVVESFADAQMQLVDAMIIDLNAHHQEQINDYMNADHLVPELSLFDDPDFISMIRSPIDFSNPLPTEAGFFGS
jgi:hypothetical protein